MFETILSQFQDQMTNLIKNEIIVSSSQDATTSEDTTNPLGIIGFSLKYTQASC